MDQHKAPLFEKLKSMAMNNRSSFHIPGHKFGQDLSEDERQLFGQVMSIDYTEITGLDDLHHPHGIIEEAENLAAGCFHADRTFFLVGGSTVGNLALILSTCQRNDIIIVQRDVHKSILHGLMLAGAQAVFLSPCLHEASGLAVGVSIEAVGKALLEYPQAQAVFLSNPNYYGMGIHLREIAELVHAHHIPLLVDEAHGAHFGFHPQVPESAISCGADGVVQSTHKMLSALTMGGMLHVQGNLLQMDVIRQRLSMLQSSSPSYPIMASLDMSRRIIALDGERKLSLGLEAVNHFKQNMLQLSWFTIITNTFSESFTQDPFKVAVKDETGTLTGYQLQKHLEDFDCMVEMADPVYVLLVFSLSSNKQDSGKLFEAFSQISKQLSLEKKELLGRIANINRLPQITQIVSPVLFDLQYLMPKRSEDMKTIRMQDAAQTRCAEMVIPYPPGIPLLYPGEVITSSMVEYLLQLSRLGATFQGAKRIDLQTITVYK